MRGREEVKFKVKPILAGKFGPVRDDIKYRNGNPSLQEMVPSYIFHAESGSLNVIVDMSFGSVEKCIRMMGLKCERKGSLEEILRNNGVDRSKVDTVICTHLHWDHAGNGKLFPNAKIICQREELNWAIAPPGWEPGYSKAFSDEIIEVADRIMPVDGNIALYDGLELVKLGGHSPGSQAVVINTDNGKVVIAGDIAMTYRNIEDLIPIGLLCNLEECVRGINWLKSQNAIILPGHDWKVMEYEW